MKRVLAGFLTLALMGLLLRTSLRRDTQSSAPPSLDAVPSAAPANPARSEAIDPAEARIHDLLASASAGDVPAYLDAFTVPLRARLEREVSERGAAAFADDLRRAARARKSHAVFAAEHIGPGAARVLVEAVYPDRNERQTFRLEQAESGWQVAEVETVRSIQPKAKFGAPAVSLDPERAPTQEGVSVETGDEAPDGPTRSP